MSREKNVYMGKLAEKTERYEEMLEFMENVLAGSEELTVEERNLFYVASKNVINARLVSWRIISSLEREEVKHGGEDHHLALIRDYRSKIESEISETCNRTLELLDSRLIPVASAGDSKVLYLKMKADYRCYISEFKGGKDYTKAVNNAYTSYLEAERMAITELAPRHPIRLGLALNFSIFQSDFQNDRSGACLIAEGVSHSEIRL